MSDIEPTLVKQMGIFKEQMSATVSDTEEASKQVVEAYTAIKTAIADYEQDFLTFKGLANKLKQHI